MYRTKCEHVGPHLSKALGGVGWRRAAQESRVLGSWVNTGWEIPLVASEPGGNVKIKDLTYKCSSSSNRNTITLSGKNTFAHLKNGYKQFKFKMMVRRAAGLLRWWTSCQEVTMGCLPFSHWCSLRDYSKTLHLSLFLAHKDIKLVWDDFSKILPKVLSLWKSQCCLPCYYPCLFSSPRLRKPTLPDF